MFFLKNKHQFVIEKLALSLIIYKEIKIKTTFILIHAQRLIKKSLPSVFSTYLSKHIFEFHDQFKCLFTKILYLFLHIFSFVILSYILLL